MAKATKPKSPHRVARDRVAKIMAIDPEPTAANRQLRQVRVLALALKKAAARWADRHGAGACCCPFCTRVGMDRCGRIEAELGGVVATAGWMADALEPLVYPAAGEGGGRG